MNLGGVIHLNKTGICVLFCGILVLFVYMLTNHYTSDNHGTQKINLKFLLKVAIKAAENGGAQVVASKDNPFVKKKGLTKEGMEDSVTAADYLSHCSMLGTLKHAYPTLSIISEEETDCDMKKEIDFTDSSSVPNNFEDEWVDIKDIKVWIDPLDATHEYTEKLFKYVTTMVCVAVKGQPVIGVIHKPFSKPTSETFWGWVNKAKSPNLQVTKNESDKLRIIISRSHRGDIEKVINKNLKDLNINNPVIAAGAGYKAVEVATGKADAYLHITAIKKWDICAANAIIKTMGGKMTTKFGELIDYGDSNVVENEKGLIATLKNNDMFIGKL